MKVGNNNPISIENLFRGNLQYRIPPYQRRYIWDKTNWRVLWTDIEQLLSMKEKNKQHFTGTIATRLYGTESTLEKLEIIDGQQRLTTFQIIFCVIRDIAASSEYAESGLELKLKDIIELPEYDAKREKSHTEKIADSNTQDEFSPYRLVPKGYDRKTFQLLIEHKTPDHHSGISLAYKYFKDRVTDYLQQESTSLGNLVDVLLGNFQFIPIEIELGDEPEKIFESINDTGRALDEFDYLWNHLFLRARKIGKHKSDKFYNLHWKRFEEEPFWDSSERRDLFFRVFLMAKWGPKYFEAPRKRVKTFDLYREYSKALTSASDYIKARVNEPELNQIEYEFRQLSAYATSYQELHDPSLVSEDSELRKFGSQMKFDNLNLQNLDSFILFLVHEAELIGGNLLDVFEILESYIVRRMLCAKHNEDIYTEIHASFSKAIETPKFKVRDLVDFLYGSWPDTEQIKRALEQAKSKNDELILYILYKIELRKGGTKNSQLDFNSLQGPEPIVNRLFLHDNYHAADNIGNLMLLTSSPDDGLSASPFDNEKKMHLMELAGDLVSTTEICAKESWSTTEIKDRETDLFSHFEQIWKPIEEFM